MYPLSPEYFYRFEFVKLWAILAFQAGFVNSFGFLACGRYVSHVTGYGTQVGLALGQRKPWLAVEMLLALGMFIFGAFVSSMMTAAAKDRGHKPNYLGVTLLLPIIYLGTAIMGQNGVFGGFGEEFLLFHDYAFLLILSFACGLQNGCFASMTGGVIRTTHLTGLSTDIGTDLARLWAKRNNRDETFRLRRANQTRLVILTSFAMGAIFSATFSATLKFQALYIPVCTGFAIFVALRVASKRIRD